MLSQIDKQILRAHVLPRLDKLLGRAPTRGPRVAVVGNCQSYGIAFGMKVLAPSAQVDHYSVVHKTLANIDRLAKTLAGYDRVFLQNFPAGIVKGGDYEDLLARLTNVTRMPSLVFAAFHPDLIYLLDATRGHKPLNGPLRPYHSALAVFAFRVGLSLQEANALFNDNVFATVGYYDIWNASARELIRSGQELLRLRLLERSYELVAARRLHVFDRAPQALRARDRRPAPAGDRGRRH